MELIIYYWLDLGSFFTPTGPAKSFTPLRPVATEPYKLNCTPTALRPRATAFLEYPTALRPHTTAIFGAKNYSDRRSPRLAFSADWEASNLQHTFWVGELLGTSFQKACRAFWAKPTRASAFIGVYTFD